MKHIFFACLTLVCLSASTAVARQTSLEAGIHEIRGGDPLRGLATLNDALRQSAGSPQVAMIHAYRALAFVRMDQPERARAAAVLALQANPNLAIGLPDFTPDVVAVFDRVRSAPAGPEDAAAVAEAAGRFQDAFAHLVAAYRALPNPIPPGDDRRLRERIINTAQKLATPPPIPAQARDHANKAQSLLDADALLGKSAGTATAQAAATELRLAVRLAPWWGDAAFRLATQLQKLQLVDEALLNVSMFKLADPKGYASIDAATRKPTTAPAPARDAEVYVYWPPQVRGGGRPKVYCDANRVADLNDRHYVRLSVPAGMHTLKFHKTSLPIGVDGGQTYYVRASAEGFPAKAALRIVSADEAVAEMKEKNVELNDPKKTYSAGCSAPLQKR